MSVIETFARVFWYIWAVGFISWLLFPKMWEWWFNRGRYLVIHEIKLWWRKQVENQMMITRIKWKNICQLILLFSIGIICMVGMWLWLIMLAGWC